MRCKVKKHEEFSDLYRSQKSEIFHDCMKADRVTNTMIINSVTLQLLNPLSIQKIEWESEHSVKIKAKYAKRCFWWESTISYNTDDLIWNAEQVCTNYTDSSDECTEDFSCTESRYIWWNHQLKTDVSECRSQR